MKKLLCAILVFVMTATLCAPVTAVETESPFVPETFTREQLLAMDPELDSDNDGLVDVIELVYEMNRYDADTDGDGVSDYTEFCVTCTDPLTPDGHLDTDGDGLTNAQEGIHGTNPDDLDTDNDNLGDYAEIMTYHTDPLVKDNNTLASRARPNIQPVPGDGGGGFTRFSSTLHTKYVISTERQGDTIVKEYADFTSSVSYDFETNWFFANNKTYNQELAITSSLLAAIAYDDNYLSNVGTVAATSTDAVKHWFNYHGFTGYDSYDLDYDPVTNPQGCQDQHVSEMFVANKSITQNGVTKNLVCVVVRGTNDTLDEWQSDFDIGTTADFGSVSEWTDSTNHMGFDITANRLNDKLTTYLSNRGFTSSNTVLWITGHSRGAAVANLIGAKRIDAGYNVYGYCFATPATTTYTGAATARYDSIFNIINEDDLVPQLPLSEWAFRRYGEDVTASIETSYASQWDAMVTRVNGTVQYTSGKRAMQDAVEALSGIAEDRNECYLYPTGGYYIQQGYYTLGSAESAAEALDDFFPVNMDGTYRWVTTGSMSNYGYVVYQKPAFLMQLTAATLANHIVGIEFLFTDVATYLGPAKESLAKLSGFNLALENRAEHPHYVESYYLLATQVEP